MRRLVLACLLVSCHGAAPTHPAPALPPSAATAAPPIPPAAAPARRPAAPPAERLTADTPNTTPGGASFVAPAGWSLAARGPAIILEAPEPGSRVALVDVPGGDADAAVAAAWAAYRPDATWPVKIASDSPDKNGWSKIRAYSYQTSPSEHRAVAAIAQRAGDTWTVVIVDLDEAVAEKRTGQLTTILGRLLPRGQARESFAGKLAAKLDPTKLATLSAFVERARQNLGIPGIAIGVVQDGKIAFAGGFGVRELGGKTKVDGDTAFLIASNTKALTTLMLAKLVERGRLSWDTPVIQLLPGFRLGDADTTSKVMVKHLICACTGLPRQDLEWLLEYKTATPETSIAALGKIQPTSKFGEMFQYSNSLAGAAGFVGGHVAFPGLELGAAYDKAMQTLVFDPLGMTSTTFDRRRAQRGNHAGAYATSIDGQPAAAVAEINDAVVALRPAGGAWSTARDLLKYVQMELASGALPDGKRYIAADPLLARRQPQVSIGQDDTYGMGLDVNTASGITVIHHGGHLVGYFSDMIWLPEHGVGAVILTNGEAGGALLGVFRRKLLELLFEGRAEADAELAADTKAYFEQFVAERKLLAIPADAELAGKLAAHYTSEALGELAVRHPGKTTVFDFGEWKTEVASRKNPDGSISFLTIAPGVIGLEFVVGTGATRTLAIRDAQHEYTFTEN